MLSFEDNDDDGCDSISKGSGSSSAISRRKRPYLSGSQCRAWRFQLMVRANLCNASTAVEKQTLLLQHLSLRTGHNMPDCVTGVVVFCDASLFSQPPERDGLVSIEMLGYVQARHATRLSTLNKWVDSATWNPVPGGLTSDHEYLLNMRRFQDPNDEWTRLLVFGSIGANNTGRFMEKAARQVACLLENYLRHCIVSCNAISLMDVVLPSLYCRRHSRPNRGPQSGRRCAISQIGTNTLPRFLLPTHHHRAGARPPQDHHHHLYAPASRAPAIRRVPFTAGRRRNSP